MEKLDRVFDLSSVKRRRYVLYYLEERRGPVPLSEVVATVEEWETDASSEEEDDIVRLNDRSTYSIETAIRARRRWSRRP